MNASAQQQDDHDNQNMDRRSLAILVARLAGIPADQINIPEDFSYERGRGLVQQYYYAVRVPIMTPTLVKRFLPIEGPFDEQFARDLEDHIARHSSTITRIELMAEEGPNSPDRYLEAALRGMMRGRKANNGERALEYLSVYGSEFKLNMALITKILLAAPKKLELAIGIVEGGSDDNDDINNTSWENCHIEELDVYQCNADCDEYVEFVKTLANLSSLKKVTLDLVDEFLDDPRFGQFEETIEATKAIVSMLDSNQQVESLCLTQILPDMTLFCEQLKKCTKLRELDLPKLYHPEVGGDEWRQQYEMYFKALVEVIKERDVLERITYEDGGAVTPWGPSSIKRYLALNAKGKRKPMLGTELTGEEFLQSIAQYTPNVTPEEIVPAADAAAFSNWKGRWAIGMIYGLLRESPGFWSTMATEEQQNLMEGKPSARPSLKRVVASEGASPPPSKKRKSCTSTRS